MLGAIYEQDHWLEMRSRKLTFGESIDPGPSPIRKAQATALIHFPELVQPLRLLDLKSSEYQQWMIKAYAARLDGKYAEMNEGFTEAYNGWMIGMSSFLDTSAKYASDRSGAV
ncbi:hypothetical protein HFO98_01695 [Rhizobium leguminosarum]|uniref:hypothetical protein n=1 Tax=Rhizobium leguminosarum TaxID=384 RepID=UPI001C94060E|nr:hypothetical protein [Rhizobium leguminosarum]MBY5407202.1 hypothetical protein [Rhizobium leguminosarum]